MHPCAKSILPPRHQRDSNPLCFHLDSVQNEGALRLSERLESSTTTDLPLNKSNHRFSLLSWIQHSTQKKTRGVHSGAHIWWIEVFEFLFYSCCDGGGEDKITHLSQLYVADPIERLSSHRIAKNKIPATCSSVAR